MAQLAWSTTPWQNTIGAWVRTLSQGGTTIVNHPELTPGERILTVDDGSAAVASTHALYHRDGDEPDRWIRIGWEEIESARWHPGQRTLTLTRHPGSGHPPSTVHLTEPGRLPEVSRDRVAATIIATRQVTIESGPAWITVRRRPGTDALLWTVRLRDHSPDTDRQVDHAIRALRADLGI